MRKLAFVLVSVIVSCMGAFASVGNKVVSTISTNSIANLQKKMDQQQNGLVLEQAGKGQDVNQQHYSHSSHSSHYSHSSHSSHYSSY